MDKSLVLAADREHAGGVGGESCAHNVLTMSRVALGGVRIVNSRVTEHVYETPIVARYNKLAIWANLHLVDVSAIFSGGVHTLNIPS